MSLGGVYVKVPELGILSAMMVPLLRLELAPSRRVRVMVEPDLLDQVKVVG